MPVTSEGRVVRRKACCHSNGMSLPEDEAHTDRRQDLETVQVWKTLFEPIVPRG